MKLVMNYKEFYSDLTETYQGDNFKFSKTDADQIYNNNPLGGNVMQRRVKHINDILERNIPTSADKWAKAKAAARAKFKVYPSAYANLWAAKKYKSMGGGWKKGKKNEYKVPHKNRIGEFQ
jgi:hypothetical protein